MLYLEDYLEMIENLPMEMRDRLTEVRENDLEVQNSLDSLEETVKTYFKKCQQNSLKDTQKTEQFDKIKQSYLKALEETDEKVQIANQIYEIVERHLRKLDHELSKFKMELEADNAGITEVLEKRSLEAEHAVSSSSRGEKRKAFHLSNLTNTMEKRPTLDKTPVPEPTPQVGTVRRAVSASSSPAVHMFTSTPVTPNNFALGTVGTTTNEDIKAAASQAIAATQQITQQPHTGGGRRTPNVKVNVSNNTELSKDLAFARDAAFTASQFTPEVTPSRSQRNKKQSAKAAALMKQQQEQQQKQQQHAAAALAATTAAAATTPATAETTIIDENGQPVTWTYDPNEPRYCLCNEVSYGDMVGCDNPDCPNEWFHYPCVGLTQAPKGKWFCPQCTASMKRRGRHR